MIKPDLLYEVPEVFITLTAQEHVTYSPSISGEFYTGPENTLEARTAIAALTGLVFAAYRAQKAADLALSWRDYRVGATAAMFNFEHGLFSYLDGYNVKTSQGDSALNLHAEQIALAKGRRQRLNRLMGIAIYADPTDEDANPDGFITLRPCTRCVTMFEGAPEVDMRTIILGVNPDFSQCELYTVGSLIAAEDVNALNIIPTFGLRNDEDFERYDKEIQPRLIEPIYKLFREQKI